MIVVENVKQQCTLIANDPIENLSANFSHKKTWVLLGSFMLTLGAT
jgi:hypothetical protein